MPTSGSRLNGRIYCAVDKSGVNPAALHAVNAERETSIKICQSKYLNDFAEQDHRPIKRRTRLMLAIKNFRCACILLGGIECMRMIAKRQTKRTRGTHQSIANRFHPLAT